MCNILSERCDLTAWHTKTENPTCSMTRSKLDSIWPCKFMSREDRTAYKKVDGVMHDCICIWEENMVRYLLNLKYNAVVQWKFTHWHLCYPWLLKTLLLRRRTEASGFGGKKFRDVQFHLFKEQWDKQFLKTLFTDLCVCNGNWSHHLKRSIHHSALPIKPVRW